jgi:Xaa-Pro aminopeptidase
MAVSGPPSAELEDLLAEVRAVQDAAMGRVQAGVVGREVYEVAADAVRRSPHAERIEFVAHGVGLVPHEAPRLSDSTPIRYPATHAERPLEAGMVLSIETDLRLEGVGLVKLEDTVAVTDGGCEAYGGAQQDWIAV